MKKKMVVTEIDIKDLKEFLDKVPEKVCKCRRDTNMIGGFYATTKGVYCNSCGGKR
jgi:hypothetical protein